MRFDPEDSTDYGPHCRNCHKGSSDCEWCHDATGVISGTGTALDKYRVTTWPKTAEAGSNADAVLSWQQDTVGASTAGTNALNAVSTVDTSASIESHSRTVFWDANWRTDSAVVVNTACSNDGFSWPHRTLGFKLLKDEMWGLDFDGTEVWVGETRDGLFSYVTTGTSGSTVIPTGMGTTSSSIPANLMVPAHDLDSACLDCHNPDIWNVVDMGDSTDLFNRKDRPGIVVDNYNDELILRGLP